MIRKPSLSLLSMFVLLSCLCFCSAWEVDYTPDKDRVSIIAIHRVVYLRLEYVSVKQTVSTYRAVYIVTRNKNVNISWY